ncbi:MAG: hypothetical protein JWP74_493 [Marmoricola sp.]|nr:hypothetical protein [Marmoricola sp.]
MVLKKSRVTYANVASTLALVIAIGGGGAASAAAIHLAHNSVGSPQIINGSVKQADLGANSVGTGKVINHSLTHADFTKHPVGLVQGYAWDNVETATLGSTVTLHNGYEYNSAGHPVTVNRSATGVYTVTFVGLNFDPGNVQVTAYGSDTATWCKVGGWEQGEVSVYCYDGSGAAADSRFDISVLK